MSVSAVLLVIGFFSVNSLRRFDAAEKLVTRAHELRSTVGGIIALLTDAEAGQRGFVITGDSAYLGPMSVAPGAIDRSIRALRDMTRADAAQTARLAQAELLIARRLARMDSVVAARAGAGLVAATALIRTNSGRETTDSIRSLLRTMEAHETSRLLPLQRVADETASRTLRVVALGVLVAGLVTVGGGLVIHRDMGSRLSAERAAREDRARIAAILNTVADGILVTTVDGTILDSNPAAERIFGYEPGGLKGLKAAVLVPAELTTPDRQLLRRFATDGDESAFGKPLDLRGRRRDGSEFPVEFTLNEIATDRPPRLFTAVARDLSTHRALETERETIETRFRIATGVMAEGVVVQDATGRVIDCNGAAEYILGMPREQVLRLGDSDWRWAGIHEDGSPFLKEDHPANLALKTGLPVRNVVMGVRRGDRTRWLLINSAPMRTRDMAVTGVVSTFTDITRRREAEQRVREEEERLRDFLDNASDLILSTDPAGAIVFANLAFRRTLGYDDAQVQGRSIFELLDPECHESLRTAFARILRGEAIDGLDATFLTADGRRVHVQGNSNARFESGEPVAIRSIFRDMTELRAALEMVTQARDSAEQSSRTKSEFLANMSHELRTPLNSVIGFASVLLKNRGGAFSEQELQYLQRIHDNGRHLLYLINSVLDLSKIEAGRMELDLADVPLDKFISATLEQMQGQLAGRPIELHTEHPPVMLPIRSDAAKLKQVLINLVGNALKFTERGSVTVRVAADAAGTPLRIDIVDTGIGIPRERLAAVFEAFQQADNTTSRKYGGTGLGLSITRSLALLMGYRVTVESEPGAGSTFSLHLKPAGVAPTTAARTVRYSVAAPEVRVAPISGALPLVLVIDDDPDARMLISQFIRDFGCETITAASGAAGLRIARELRPSLITLDIMMPHMNGIEVLNALKSDPELEPIPVVIVSIVGSEQRSQALNAVAVIDKPVSREELEAVISPHIDIKRTTPELREELSRLVKRYTGQG